MDMKHIITDEEVKRAWVTYYQCDDTDRACIKKVLTEFLANRPQVAQLRPIAEMPETVPEGCIRFRTSLGAYKEGKWTSLTPYQEAKDTHFIDIQLPTPDPEGEILGEFERWWSGLPDRTGKHKSECFEAYKAGKLAKKGCEK